MPRKNSPIRCFLNNKNLNQDNKERPINFNKTDCLPKMRQKIQQEKLEAETTINHTTVGSSHINPGGELSRKTGQLHTGLIAFQRWG